MKVTVLTTSNSKRDADKVCRRFSKTDPTANHRVVKQYGVYYVVRESRVTDSGYPSITI